jgi:tetratricopeptide (TPR) repeat protein
LVNALVMLGALGLVASAAPAAAQSRRYPPAPADKDARAAARSALWSAAVTPERRPYQELVRAATAALAGRTGDQTIEAIKKLDQAIGLLPHEPEAYRLRGDAQLERRAWAACAADYAAAEAYGPHHDDPPPAPFELRRKLGLCQARAGKLGDAERTLAALAASGNGSAEVWMRLGEVRIAMGKLDGAIAALTSGLEGSDQSAQAMIRFLLAAAYDRARRPADALIQASAAVKLDPQLTVLQNPTLPGLGDGELDYLLGLGYGAEPVRLELALAHFRRFVAVAPRSPWRRRADEHIRDLKRAELPDRVVRSGTAAIDLEATRAIVRRAMPAMRACVAGHPTAVVEVEISRAGPRTQGTDRIRPRFFTPPDGVAVRRVFGELTVHELDAIDRCLSPLATRLALPAVKERDAYYKLVFQVVGS